MYTPELAPVGGSLALSALVASLPFLTVFLALGVLRWKAHWAGLTGLAVAVLVAVLGFRMPIDLALLASTQGFVFGLFPIMWIVLNAIWLYELTVRSGRFEDLRRVINALSDDPRIQAVIIAFGFGGLLEALAGFGAPVAITGVMLMAAGFRRCVRPSSCCWPTPRPSRSARSARPSSPPGPSRASTTGTSAPSSATRRP
jgi:lactate permease